MSGRIPIAAAAAAAALALCAIASADDHVRARDGAAAIDWTAGVMTAPGAAAGDLRAPSAQVARVGAERAARTRARELLAERVRGLKTADGATVAARVDADPAAAARLATALEHTLARDVRYSTDGSVTLREAVALEAVRLALSGAPAPPQPAADDPTAVIIDASEAVGLAPALGFAVESGSERYHGPTVFYRKIANAQGDRRLGPRVVELGLRAVDGDGLQVDADPARVARLRKAGALVVVVLPGSKS